MATARRAPRYDTEAWPYLEAKFHGPKRVVPVRLIVVHTPEWPESASGAEAVARYFHDMPDGRKASANILTDNDSIVQSVLDSYEPYAAPPDNDDGWHMEITGYANQTKKQWLDKFSLAALALSADAAAQACLKFGIPPVKLTVAQVKDRRTKGICGHDDVTAAFHKSTHEDPGPNFPWKKFITWTAASVLDRV